MRPLLRLAPGKTIDKLGVDEIRRVFYQDIYYIGAITWNLEGNKRKFPVFRKQLLNLFPNLSGRAAVKELLRPEYPAGQAQLFTVPAAFFKSAGAKRCQAISSHDIR
jgi:hypothetical protein